MEQRKQQRATQKKLVTASKGAGTPAATGTQAAWLPSVLTVVFFLMSFLPRVQSNVVLTRSFWGAAAVLLLWQAALWMRPGGRHLDRAGTAQARSTTCRRCVTCRSTRTGAGTGRRCRTTCGCWWRSWCSRTRSTCCSRGRGGAATSLGFGPLPIVFSTNLFLWFRDDWFYLQFLLVAAGFLGKEFVRWEREGKSVHIFNPSAFSLGALLDRPDRDRHHEHHVGAGDCVDAEPRAVHLRVPVPRRPGRDVFLLDHARGRVRGGDALRVERAVLGGDRHAVLPRLGDSDGRVPRPAPARHRSVNFAADASRTHDLRRAVRARRLRPVRAARRHGRTDVLRQAALRAAPEPVGARDRPRRPGAWRPALDDRAEAGRAARPPQPRAHGRVDRVLRPDDRDGLDRRHAPRRSRARSGSRRAPKGGAAPVRGCCRSKPLTAPTTPDGRATSSARITHRAGS